MGILQTTITKRTSPIGTSRLYPNIVSYKSITNDDLVDYMMNNSGINKVVALAAAAALRQAFSNYVLNGHTLKVPQLGTFSLSARTKAVDDIKDADSSCIRKLRVRFTPHGSTAKACKSVKFHSLLSDEVQMAGN